MHSLRSNSLDRQDGRIDKKGGRKRQAPKSRPAVQRDDLEKKYRELQDLEWHKDHHQRHRLENVRDDVVQAIACIEDKEYRSALDILHSVASMLYSE